MAVKNFEELKLGVCKQLGAPVPDNGEDGANEDAFMLTIGDVAVMTVHSPKTNPDRAFLFCDYGDVPEDIELFVLRRLLEMNFLLYRGNSPAFCRDVTSGHIMLMGELLFATTTPASALEIMQRFAAHVKEWRRTHFVEDLVMDDPAARHSGAGADSVRSTSAR